MQLSTPEQTHDANASLSSAWHSVIAVVTKNNHFVHNISNPYVYRPTAERYALILQHTIPDEDEEDATEMEMPARVKFVPVSRPTPHFTPCACPYWV
jgi:hypothetical protein